MGGEREEKREKVGEVEQTGRVREWERGGTNRLGEVYKGVKTHTEYSADSSAVLAAFFCLLLFFEVVCI